MIRYEVLASYEKKYTPIRGFPGLTLRGAIGYALRTINCPDMGMECTRCPRYRVCPYARLYETTPITNPGSDIATKLEAVTNPLTVEVLVSTPRQIGFAINLFGDATELRKEIILAVFAMAQLGLGYCKKHLERRRLRIARITEHVPALETVREIYDGEKLKLDNIAERAEKSLLASFAGQAKKIAERQPTHLQVEFQAPYRVEGSYTPTYRQLLMNIARRYSLLAEYHNAGKRLTKADARRLAQLASRAETVEATHGKTITVTKRSAKTGDRQSYGKFAERGRIVYRLPPGFWQDPYAPLATALTLAGQYLHAGKLATGGYGKYKAEYYL